MNFKPFLIALFCLAGFVSGQTHNAIADEKECIAGKLVVLGDSLVAGYGLNPGESFPEQLDLALSREGYEIEVINAGVSGDTSSGGLARLDWSVPQDADAVIVELGANDALRGISPEITRSNIGKIIQMLKVRGAEVLIAGMMAPPNMGPDYGKEFNQLYPALAEEHNVILYPFFLDGVAAVAELNQADGIHPNARGIAEIVQRFFPFGEKLMKQACE